jgi:hypothetical protein
MTQVPVQIEDFIKKQILRNHISKVSIQVQVDDDAGAGPAVVRGGLLQHECHEYSKSFNIKRHGLEIQIQIVN